MRDTSQNTDVIVGKTEPRHLLRRLSKKILFGGLVVIIAAAVIAGVILYRQQQHNKQLAKIAAQNTCIAADSGNLLKQAVQNLDPSRTAQLQPLVVQIQRLKNYNEDPNCLYVLATYYINTIDVNNAKIYIAKYNEAYKKVHSLSPILANYIKNHPSLNELLKMMIAAVNQDQNNIIPLYAPPK